MNKFLCVSAVPVAASHLTDPLETAIGWQSELEHDVTECESNETTKSFSMAARLNADALVKFLRGESDKAVQLFQQALTKPFEAVHYPILKSLLWLNILNDDHSTVETNILMQQNVYHNLTLAREAALKIRQSSAVPSIFDLPLQRKICTDPFYDYNRAGKQTITNWHEQYLDLLKRSITNYLYRENYDFCDKNNASLACASGWDITQGSAPFWQVQQFQKMASASPEDALPGGHTVCNVYFHHVLRQ